MGSGSLEDFLEVGSLTLRTALGDAVDCGSYLRTHRRDVLVPEGSVPATRGFMVTGRSSRGPTTLEALEAAVAVTAACAERDGRRLRCRFADASIDLVQTRADGVGVAPRRGDDEPWVPMPSDWPGRGALPTFLSGAAGAAAFLEATASLGVLYAAAGLAPTTLAVMPGCATNPCIAVLMDDRSALHERDPSLRDHPLTRYVNHLLAVFAPTRAEGTQDPMAIDVRAPAPSPRRERELRAALDLAARIVTMSRGRAALVAELRAATGRDAA